MSYQIYYSRAYVRLDDNHFIPMICSGSNNCWEDSRKPEKIWSVIFDAKNPDKVVYTKDEIIAIADEAYDSLIKHGGDLPFKSRYKTFSAKEFRNWIVNGIRSSYTVEDYSKMGNRLYVSTEKATINDWDHRICVTTDELQKALSSLPKGLYDCQKITFSNRNIVIDKMRMVRYGAKHVDSYYAIKSNGLYLCGFSKRTNCSFTREPRDAKKFLTRKKAEQYMAKVDYASYYRMDVKKIWEPAYI